MTNLAPIWTFACRKARECVRLKAENRELAQALAIVRADRDALSSHLMLAIRQRDHARVLLTGTRIGEPACDIGAEVEAFLRGEGPA